MRENKRRKRNSRIISLLLFILNVFTGILLYRYFLKKKRDLQKFAEEEKQDWNALLKGRERPSQFFHRSLQHLKDFFIPHEGNNHKPKSLRARTLIFYLIIALVLKAGVTVFLFFTYPTPAEMSRIIASKMIELTNIARRKNNIHELRVNEVLTASAFQKGQDMIERDYFAHDTPEGKKPWEWINKSQYDYVYAGENLAMDFSSAEMIQEAFMRSPTHRRNILNPNFRDIGVAVVTGEMFGRQVDLLVEFFGTRREEYLALKSQGAIAGQSSSIQDLPSSSEQINQPIQIAGSDREIAPEGEQPLYQGNEFVPESILVLKTERGWQDRLIDFLLQWSNILYLAFIIFITLSLLLNIFIKIKIQHGSLILQGLAAIALLAALILTKIHFIEKLPQKLLIL